jgi:hypothetical protein
MYLTEHPEELRKRMERQAGRENGLFPPDMQEFVKRAAHKTLQVIKKQTVDEEQKRERLLRKKPNSSSRS